MQKMVMKLFSCCSMCKGQPGQGDYALETYNKVPFVGSLSNFFNIKNLIGGGGGGGMQGQPGSERGFLSNITDMIPGGGGGLAGLAGLAGMGGIGKMIGAGGIMGFLNKFSQNKSNNSFFADDSSAAENIFNTKDQVIRKIKKSNYGELVKEYQGSNQKFTDPDFKPNLKSLGNLDGGEANDLQWKRIPDVIQNPVFIKDSISPDDILQGALGDCYFLSAISALAESEWRIRNLFPSLEINPNGFYMAKILYAGQYQQVVVDDYIPVNSRGKVHFAQPAGGNQIWVIILEKCWAKLHGNYHAIVGGLPNQVLHAFSGAPVFYKSVKEDKQSQDKLWKEMFEADQNGGLLACGTKNTPQMDGYGFVTGHAYTILGLFEKPNRLIRIRNPWGKKQWNGRASDKDHEFWSKVPAADKQTMGYSDKNEGTFFMLYEDFVEYFFMVDICKLNDNSNYNFVPQEFSSNGQLHKMEIRSTGDVTVALTQQSTRGMGAAVENKGYSRSYMVVAKDNRDSNDGKRSRQLIYIDSQTAKRFPDNYIELYNLEAGKYLIYSEFKWINNQQVGQAVISSYSTQPTVIEPIEKSQYPEFLEKTFLNHASKSPKKHDVQQLNGFMCNQFVYEPGCFFGYFAVSTQKDAYQSLDVDIGQNQYTQRRFTLKQPFRGKGRIKKRVKPGEDLVIVYKLKQINFPSINGLPTPNVNLVDNA